MSDSKRLFGITVLADFILNEGVNPILDGLAKLGVNAVAVNPIVTGEAAEGQGSWQPPDDAGSSPRLFDRPLWGKRELWVRSGPSYTPDVSLYADTSYKPKQPNDLTEAHGHLVGDFIDEALARGFEVYFQIPGATPSGLQDKDRRKMPDGSIPDAMVDVGSLASEDSRAYLRAFVQDLLQAYPNVTGFRPDWPEYPCYKLPETFVDFGEPVKIWAEARGIAFEALRLEVGEFYTYLTTQLTNEDIAEFAEVERGRWAQLRLLRRFPAIGAWLRLKTALSLDLLRFWREAITEAGGQEKVLSANAFMPPLTLFTGLDIAGTLEIAQAVSPKLYTMHWSAMVEFWGRALMAKNDLDEALVVKALVNLFDIDDEATATRISDYGYPGNDEPHPIPDGPQARRIRQVLSDAGGRGKVTPLMHGYGPIDDFARRFRIVAESEADGVWINRYGYLSDAKLEAVGEIWGET
jgi:hypothetical protein